MIYQTFPTAFPLFFRKCLSLIFTCCNSVSSTNLHIISPQWTKLSIEITLMKMHLSNIFSKSSSHVYLAIFQIDTLLKVCIAADHWSLNLTSILQSDIIHDHWVHNLYQPINMRLPPNPSRESRSMCYHHLHTRAYATMATNNRSLDATFITHFRPITKHTMWPNL
mgnify:FL=1